MNRLIFLQGKLGHVSTGWVLSKVCALPPGAWLKSVLLSLYVEIRPIVNPLNSIPEILVWYFSSLLAREQYVQIE